MASLGETECDSRGLRVPDVAHQDDVGVQVVQRPQHGRGAVSACPLDRNLVDAREVELDRVLGGHDVRVGLVERHDRRVQRGRLARPSGTDHQHHSLTPHQRIPEALERTRLEAQLGHVQHELRLVEQPHDDLLAPQGGEHGHAEVEVAASVLDLHLDLDMPILGPPLFRDVELGHDLDAGDERVPQLHGQRHHVVEDPVDAEPDAELLLVGLDVDVRGLPLERVHEEHVRELDDGRGVRGLGEVAEIDLVVHRLGLLDVRVGFAHRIEVELGEAADRGHVVDAQRRAVEDLLDAPPRRPPGDPVATPARRWSPAAGPSERVEP